MKMKTGKEIIDDYISSRNHSVRKMDNYARSLITFYFQSQLHQEEEGFLKLLGQAESQNKFIVYVRPFEEDVPYDDYILKDLIIADEPE